MAGNPTQRPVLALALALVALASFAFPAATSQGQCVAAGSEFTRQIVAANPLNEHLSASELLVLVVAPVAPVSIENLAQDVDSSIIDLGCDVHGGGYALSGDDEGSDLYTLRSRFYSDDVELLGQTECGKEASGRIPSGTHFIAIVPCEGVPVGLHGLLPYSVEATVLVTH